MAIRCWAHCWLGLWRGQGLSLAQRALQRALSPVRALALARPRSGWPPGWGRACSAREPVWGAALVPGLWPALALVPGQAVGEGLALARVSARGLVRVRGWRAPRSAGWPAPAALAEAGPAPGARPTGRQRVRAAPRPRPCPGAAAAG